MAKKKIDKRIAEQALSDDYFNVLHRAYEQMNEVYKRLRREEGLTQEEIAQRLGVNKSLVSRRLHGGENLTLRVLSGLATAMQCMLEVSFTPHKDLVARMSPVDKSAASSDAETARARVELRVIENTAAIDAKDASTTAKRDDASSPPLPRTR